MFLFPPTFILRHRKENLKKCSLKGLEQRTDMHFFTYPQDTLPDLSSHLLLTIDAPPLTANDSMYGIFLIDGTWKLAETMFRQLYCTRSGCVNFDSVRQSKIEARQNSYTLTGCSIAKPQHFQVRSLPAHFQTAYPRRQNDCSDPTRGLASVEALFIAYKILNRESQGLLDNYYWKDAFLKKNETALFYS
jgi:rRNA small subunit aminocarboxypropyltransferase